MLLESMGSRLQLHKGDVGALTYQTRFLPAAENSNPPVNPKEAEGCRLRNVD